MNPIIKLKASRLKPWQWFVVLWLGGLGCVALMSYAIKLSFRLFIAHI